MKDTNVPDIDHLLWNISVNDDEIAYRSLFEHYYAALCLFAKRYIEDRDVREDIVQETFFEVYRKREELMKHPNIRYTEDGGAGPFNYAKAPLAHDDFMFDETRYDDYELLLDEDIIGELF